ncbi:hypothetical protein [Sedimentitalea arenosa]|uniref:Uncharacterized protein n=1 Tax=Sedimentitalea arenosa TaxID=2798803 RepID=A0A8J7M031_9RHOB|nr:hypothetical protein [Arenibacterium arenosum]MBJ6373661.1 hypothetical protein [Arenibacterium arenosum]
MKYVLASVLTLASTIPAAAELSQRERELWAVYHSCLDPHLPDVARHVPSLEEGADLIAESLCVDEHTELLNEIARRPTFKTTTVSESFGQALFVIKRDTKLWIYMTRRDG